MNLWYEVAYSLRTIRRKLGFSALSVIVIAMGYGITMPLYSVVKNFAYTTVDFTDGDRLSFIRQTNLVSGREYDSDSFDFFQFNAIRSSNTTFESIGAYRNARTTLSDGDSAQRFNGVQITANAFSFPSVSPQLGRPLQPADELAGAQPVAVISHFVWQNYYGSAADVIGKPSRVNGEIRTIVGVMPPSYSYPDTAEVWMPLPIDSAAVPGGQDSVALIGVIAQGDSRKEASVELASTMKRLSNEHEDYKDRSGKVTPFTHGFTSNAIALFNTIGGLGICILVLICLNVGNLLLIRTNERVTELAIRNAVGASRKSLIGHVLLESLIICSVGAALGLLFSSVILNYIHLLFSEVLIDPREAPFWFDFTLNLQGLLFGFGMLAFIWFVSGVFTCWRSIRHDTATILSGHSSGAVVKDNGKTNRVLVHLQVTLSFFLLVVSGCYLFALQSSYDEASVPNSDRIVRATINFDFPQYDSVEARYRFTQELRDGLSSLSNLESLSFGSATPGRVSGLVSANRSGIESDLEQERRLYGFSAIDFDYFQNVGIEVSKGRAFEQLDNQNSEAVVIVGEGFLQREQIVEPSIGQLVTLESVVGDDVSETARIIGVVPSLAENDRAYSPEIYRPIAQQSSTSLILLLKLQSGSPRPIAEIEEEVIALARTVDRDIPLYGFGFLITEIEVNNQAIGFFVSLFSAAAIGALILSVIGVYGLISRSVMARTAEIGIRRAIGSSNSMILRIFLRQALNYLLVGTVIGGGLALIAVNVIESSALSFDLFAAIAGVFVGVTLIVSALIGYACYMPARRAIAIEPGEALHYE